jgi:hypothetical protein
MKLCVLRPPPNSNILRDEIALPFRHLILKEYIAISALNMFAFRLNLRGGVYRNKSLDVEARLCSPFQKNIRWWKRKLKKEAESKPDSDI